MNKTNIFEMLVITFKIKIYIYINKELAQEFLQLVQCKVCEV